MPITHELSLLRQFGEAPNNPKLREAAAALLATRTPDNWGDEGPADRELAEMTLKAGWNAFEKQGAARRLWGDVLKGLVEVVRREPPRRKLKEPDAHWVKPRADQGGEE